MDCLIKRQMLESQDFGDGDITQGMKQAKLNTISLPHPSKQQCGNWKSILHTNLRRILFWERKLVYSPYRYRSFIPFWFVVFLQLMNSCTGSEPKKMESPLNEEHKVY